MVKNDKPYLIVGQGIAGTLMAWNFISWKTPIILIDKGINKSASKAAAGIVNPVTGRRIVKSWMIDELIPSALASYRALEQYLNINIIHHQKIFRSLHSIREENLWLSKAGQPGYGKYLDDNLSSSDFDGLLSAHSTIGTIHHSFRVDLESLLYSFRKRLTKLNILEEENFDYNAIDISGDEIKYKARPVQGIVFCEGWRVKYNPWFKDIPWALNKGNAVKVKLESHKLQDMLKHKLFIVPVEKGEYWVGSNYQWSFEDELPSVEEQTQLMKKLSRIVKGKIEIIEPLAGIRPSTDQRRPIVGTHPQFSNLHILNGLGTKGTSLAPYWAEKLANHILTGENLPEEVNVKSFLN